MIAMPLNREAAQRKLPHGVLRPRREWRRWTRTPQRPATVLVVLAALSLAGSVPLTILPSRIWASEPKRALKLPLGSGPSRSQIKALRRAGVLFERIPPWDKSQHDSSPVSRKVRNLLLTPRHSAPGTGIALYMSGKRRSAQTQLTLHSVDGQLIPSVQLADKPSPSSTRIWLALPDTLTISRTVVRIVSPIDTLFATISIDGR
jgi:hypothetical protein